MRLLDFLSNELPSTTDALIEAYEAVPADKRTATTGEARSAKNLVAECACMNLGSAKMLKERSHAGMMETYMQDLAAMEAKSDADLLETLRASVAPLQAALGAFDDAHLNESLDFPWGPFSFAQIAAYPYWNMKYHEGQLVILAQSV